MTISVANLWILIASIAWAFTMIGFAASKKHQQSLGVKDERDQWIARITRARMNFARGTDAKEVLLDVISTADKLHVSGDWSKT